ncbi:aminotransferase class I/II-fold pyridoxal phosphate-dependent enzyme [Streptomyces sioyaensis]|uniref:Aminotransferase class I/II-fold pyridoxal phosphate-dependent enzyme n=1 Tax=Streptomyces sioyaensis TaxID=67364 RepID=A0A4V1NPK6_9ACTN|nr:aminotransferase class I/II-fold pyridoxal phosphate-dependent enzyme [Streptomyces sioyaensis]MBM4792843.1 aminotransferase class I/II-fold pyridoxal phosphate-dependent enzyme [Streptomyces sioyaensis]RXS65150.1 aminotransferase class I/II-fold pyridoxal phosphate-dependent enzyme [Streptomyces sioyaensis]
MIPVRTARRAAALGTTVFTELTELAQRTGAINLGQGFPDTDGPRAVIDRAREALVTGANQYPPLAGTPALRSAVARQRLRRYGLSYDPADEVVVTTGATEAVTAAVLALCDPGDEIIVFDPCYDAYQASADLAGAVCRRVPLRRGVDRFGLDPADLERAVSPRTRLVLLNTPHNPTGKVFTRDELEAVAGLCRRHDLVAVTDEVYEYLTYDGTRHLSLASLPGMRERTLSVSSAGKTFSLTGWKVGWACGPAALVAAVRSVKQYLTFAGGAPLQDAVAHALDREEAWVERLCGQLQDKRDLLTTGLRRAGIEVIRAEGGYFLQADVSGTGAADAADFCRTLPLRRNVVAIPTSAFSTAGESCRHLVRFAFCKERGLLEKAAQSIAAPPMPSPPHWELI